MLLFKTSPFYRLPVIGALWYPGGIPPGFFVNCLLVFCLTAHMMTKATPAMTALIKNAVSYTPVVSRRMPPVQ